MSETSSDVFPLARLSPGQDGPVLLSGPAIPPVEQPKTGSITGALRRRWALILCTWILLAGGASAFVWKHFETEYEAVGFIRVAPYIRPILKPDEGSGILPFYNAFVMGQMQSITHPGVLKRAVDSPEVKNLAWTSRTADPVDYLGRKLKIGNPEASELIEVKLLGPDPKELAPTVNAVLRAYHEKVLAESLNDDAAQLKLLRQEQTKLEEELKRQYDELYNLANEVGALSLGEKDAAFSGMTQVQYELKKAQTERVAAEARLEALKRSGPTPLTPLELEQLKMEVAATDPELISLNMARQVDEQRMMQVAQQLGPDHRDVKFTRERLEQVNRKMADRSAQVRESVAGIAEARAAALHAAEIKRAEQLFVEASQKENAYQEVTREDLAMLGAMGKNAVQLQALREKVEMNKQLYNQVLQKIQHLDVEKQRPARVTIDTWATEPMSPAEDKRPKLTILAVVVGLFMALSLAVIVDSRDTFVRSEDDVRRTVGLTVLGTRTIPKRRQVSNKDILACVAEEIRGIRGCVLFAGGREDFKTLLITSPNPREGKTRTAGDLAVALAESGRRVLLIDTDNRKRDLTRQLGADKRPGLSDLLANGHRPQDFILATSTAGLSFLPAGPACEAFSELLVQPGQMERIRDAFDAYDLVILDSPPVLLSNDACIWARFVDTILMVLRAKHSAREDALAAKDKLSQMGGRIMGAVLNGVESRPRYYSRYAYIAS